MEIKYHKLKDFPKEVKKELAKIVETFNKVDEYKTALKRIKSCLGKEYNYFSVSDYVEIKDILYEVLDDYL